MAPRRAAVKSVKSTQNTDYGQLALNNVLCPICRSILIEPVTLPCNHEFCLSCFEHTMANTNLVCPLCRLRIGSWMRKAKKEKTLVNTKLWKAIKENFDELLKNKCSGSDETFEEKCYIKLASPGEIRREYQLQKQKDDIELQKQHEAEAKASEELIKKLREEEEYQKTVEEENLQLSEAIAKQLANKLNNIARPSLSSKFETRKQGPLDRFLNCRNSSRPTQKTFTARIMCQGLNDAAKKDGFNKANLKTSKHFPERYDKDSSSSIKTECRYFKPIDQARLQRRVLVTPIKIPVIRGNRITTVARAPKGTNNFTHNYSNSPFASLRTSSIEACSLIDSGNQSEVETDLHSTRNNGSIIGLSGNSISPQKRISKITYNESPKQKKPKCESANRIVPILQRRSSKLERDSGSPPFHGFECDSKYNHSRKDESQPNCSTNNRSIKSSNIIREIQEREDLEFAKKLQKELNCSRYSTRLYNNKSRKRQSTLDEIVKSSYKLNGTIK